MSLTDAPVRPKARCLGRAVLPLLLLAAAAGCRQDMHNQPKVRPHRPSRFFDDGSSSRPLPAGAVARGFLRDDAHLYRGIGPDGKFVSELPFPADAKLLARGRERFDIYCSPCHGRTGDGTGIIARRGFKQPPTFHQDRLRNQPAGYFYDVTTNGFGVMSGYAAQVTPEDRWAIVAWVRTLQYAAWAPASDLTPADLAEVEKAGPAVTSVFRAADDKTPPTPAPTLATPASAATAPAEGNAK